MEAFESFGALAFEAEGLVVSESVKFPVRLQTKRLSHVEFQTHGYEVDLVGACADRLVLASVKSYLGSRGVVAAHVTGETEDERARRRYSLLNRPEVRAPVVKAAARRYGYRAAQVESRLYVGRFSTDVDEERVRDWARRQRAGAGPITVHGLDDVASIVRRMAVSRTYRDNPVLVTMKVLEAAGLLSVPHDV